MELSNLPFEELIELRNRIDGIIRSYKDGYLYGEAPSLVKVSKVGCHQKVLIVLWGHTHLFG